MTGMIFIMIPKIPKTLWFMVWFTALVMFTTWCFQIAMFIGKTWLWDTIFTVSLPPCWCYYLVHPNAIVAVPLTSSHFHEIVQVVSASTWQMCSGNPGCSGVVWQDVNTSWHHPRLVRAITTLMRPYWWSIWSWRSDRSADWTLFSPRILQLKYGWLL